MKKCLQKVKNLILAFHNFDIQQVPSVENIRAEALSKLGESAPHELCT